MNRGEKLALSFIVAFAGALFCLLWVFGCGGRRVRVEYPRHRHAEMRRPR